MLVVLDLVVVYVLGLLLRFVVLIVVCWVLSGCLCLGLVDFVACDWFSKLRMIGYGW